MKEISDITGWMTSGQFIVILKYDVTAVYKIKNEDKREVFFSKVWKIDMNKFKPIRGLMLGILLLEVNRPYVAGLTL